VYRYLPTYATAQIISFVDRVEDESVVNESILWIRQYKRKAYEKLLEMFEMPDYPVLNVICM
jgi:hypothetical protein